VRTPILSAREESGDGVKTLSKQAKAGQKCRGRIYATRTGLMNQVPTRDLPDLTVAESGFCHLKKGPYEPRVTIDELR